MPRYDKDGNLLVAMKFTGGGATFEAKVANTVFAGPTTGADDLPDFRALVAADIPSLSATKVTSGTFNNSRVNWASPGAIGGTAPAAGAFTSLSGITSDSATNTVTDSLIIGHESDGTPAANFGAGVYLEAKDSTTAAQALGRIKAYWKTATHASRKAQIDIAADDSAGEYVGISVGANAAALLGFFGATAVAKASAYTQTYATADKTLSAYTSDPESGAYTGLDNLQAATPYAKLTDLNSLRVAYENLRGFSEDLAALVNSLVDDMQAYGLVG